MTPRIQDSQEEPKQYGGVDGETASRDVLDSSILIVGAGIAGLITAKTLIEDGFTDVHIISSSDRVGGVWAQGEHGGVYPSLLTNSAYGNFELSPLPMPKEDLEENEHRIKGETVSRYLEAFYEGFLRGRVEVSFHTTAVHLTRATTKLTPSSSSSSSSSSTSDVDHRIPDHSQSHRSGWLVTTENWRTGEKETRRWDKVVLCQGPHSIPSFPPCLDPALRDQSSVEAENQPSTGEKKRRRPLIVHTSQIHTAADNRILTLTAPSEQSSLKSTGRSDDPAAPGENDDGGAGRIVVVGCGKSAIDLAARYASRGRRVTIVFRKPKYFAGHNLGTDYFIRTRIISTVNPAQVLSTVVERLLHQTRYGARWLKDWQREKDAGRNAALGVDESSPLHRSDIEPLWRGPDVAGGRSSATRPDSFHRLVANGTIRAIAGVSPVKISEDGKGLELSNGEVIAADFIICGTGFSSSFGFIPKDERLALGIEPIPPVRSSSANSYDPLAHHVSLRNPPAPPSNEPASHVYKGLVPVGAWEERNLVTNGFQALLGIPLTAEIGSHWISAFFQHDPNLRLPVNATAAFDHAERHAQWARARFPLSKLPYDTQNHLPLYNATQYNDGLLEDMGLKVFREERGWFGLGWYYSMTDIRNYKDLARERLEVTLKGRPDRKWYYGWLGRWFWA